MSYAPHKKVLRPFEVMWSSDRGLGLLCVFLIAEIFFLHPLAGEDLVLRAILWIASSLIVITGAAVISESKIIRSGALILAAVTLIVHALALFHHQFAILSLITSLIFNLLLAIIILLRVFRDGPVTAPRILGAIAAYLLAGMVWANLYSIIELMQVGSFHLAEGHQGIHKIHLDLIYFSFTTLTTVGYGDITPLSPYARSFSNLEALVGQLYPAILLARLVSLQAAHHSERK